ncbi:MAG: PqqD family protein [Clostridia bacterium]|nr:PqqD family protein [Clostridia bacterium]
MKIKEGYLLREVAGNYIVVAVGEAVKEFNGLVNLNESAAFLWKQLEEDKTEEQLVAALLSEYEVEEQKAKEDVGAFVKKLQEAKLIK